MRQQAAPFLKTLGQKTKLTVNMAILEQNEVVLIEKVEPPSIFRLELRSVNACRCTARV